MDNQSFAPLKTDPSAQPTAHVYFRPTTAPQRHLLFDTAAETNNVSEAARRAHTGRGTYYYWRPRVEQAGLAALDKPRSRAPHHTRIPPTSDALQQEVLDYHFQHLEAGYRTIANELRKAHDWRKVISHNEVGKIVRTACAATALPTPPPPPSPGPVLAVHAPQPNQTANIDLCVVPLTHSPTEALVSVSLTEALAGALPTVSAETATPLEWPGQAFQNSALSYEEQMRAYAEQRTAKRLSKGARKHRRRKNKPPVQN